MDRETLKQDAQEGRDMEQIKKLLNYVRVGKGLRSSSSGVFFSSLVTWYCVRISLVKGNTSGLKPLEGT